MPWFEQGFCFKVRLVVKIYLNVRLQNQPLSFHGFYFLIWFCSGFSENLIFSRRDLIVITILISCAASPNATFHLETKSVSNAENIKIYSFWSLFKQLEQK